MVYATSTIISAEKTLSQIKAVVKKAGATHFATMDNPDHTTIAFSLRNRAIRFDLPTPPRDDRKMALNGRGGPRTADQRNAAWEQANRSRWRALYLCLKAKLESIENGIETFENAFLANTQMPDGRTVSEVALPQIAASYAMGDMQLQLSPSRH